MYYRRKVCCFIINAGSCENIVSLEAVRKLGVKIETYPKPYKLLWLKKGGEVTVSKRVVVTFSIGLIFLLGLSIKTMCGVMW